MTDKKPKVVVFDLDRTLWPFSMDKDVTRPFHVNEKNELVDACGKKLEYYPDVPEILKKLHDEGYKIGIASRSPYIYEVDQLLKFYDWKKYFHYIELYLVCKLRHFSEIRRRSRIEHEDMLFFDDEIRNIHDVATQTTVQTMLVKGGMSKAVLEQGFKRFADNYKE